MNTTVACCGCVVAAVGAPYSHARQMCECSPCPTCAEFIHCKEHVHFNYDCHWCNVVKESYARMTDAERELHYGSGNATT